MNIAHFVFYIHLKGTTWKMHKSRNLVNTEIVLKRKRGKPWTFTYSETKHCWMYTSSYGNHYVINVQSTQLHSNFDIYVYDERQQGFIDVTAKLQPVSIDFKNGGQYWYNKDDVE